MQTKSERREEKRRKRGKHGHKTDGAGARLLHSIVIRKAEEAARDADSR